MPKLTDSDSYDGKYTVRLAAKEKEVHRLQHPSDVEVRYTKTKRNKERYKGIYKDIYKDIFLGIEARERTL